MKADLQASLRCSHQRWGCCGWWWWWWQLAPPQCPQLLLRRHKLLLLCLCLVGIQKLDHPIRLPQGCLGDPCCSLPQVHLEMFHPISLFLHVVHHHLLLVSHLTCESALRVVIKLEQGIPHNALVEDWVHLKQCHQQTLVSLKVSVLLGCWCSKGILCMCLVEPPVVLHLASLGDVTNTDWLRLLQSHRGHLFKMPAGWDFEKASWLRVKMASIDLQAYALAILTSHPLHYLHPLMKRKDAPRTTCTPNSSMCFAVAILCSHTSNTCKARRECILSWKKKDATTTTCTQNSSMCFAVAILCSHTFSNYYWLIARQGKWKKLDLFEMWVLFWDCLKFPASQPPCLLFGFLVMLMVLFGGIFSSSSASFLESWCLDVLLDHLLQLLNLYVCREDILFYYSQGCVIFGHLLQLLSLHCVFCSQVFLWTSFCSSSSNYWCYIVLCFMDQFISLTWVFDMDMALFGAFPGCSFGPPSATPQSLCV